MQVVAVRDRLARCHPHPCGDTDATVCGVQALDPGLDLRRRTQGAQRALEARHHTVTERLHHPTARNGDRVSHVLDMRPADQLHPIVSQARQQRGRIDQVAEYHDRHATHA